MPTRPATDARPDLDVRTELEVRTDPGLRTDLTVIVRPAPLAAASPASSPPAYAREVTEPDEAALRLAAGAAWMLPSVVAGTALLVHRLSATPARTDAEATLAAAALGEAPRTLASAHLEAYAAVTGLFGRWSSDVLAGRELATVVHALALALGWLLARQLGLARPTATAAALLSGLSPLALAYARTPSPAGLAVTWALLAAVLATASRARPAAYVLAAISTVTAVVLDPTAVAAAPLVLWLALRGCRRTFAWGTAIAVLALAFTLSGLFIAAQVSSSRSSGLFDLDPVLVVAVPLAAIAAVAFDRLRSIGCALLLLLAVVAGLQAPAAVLLLLALGPVAVAGVVELVLRRLSRPTLRRTGAAVLVVQGVVVGVTAAALVWPDRVQQQLAASSDTPAVQAVDWVVDNLDRDAVVHAPRRVAMDLRDRGRRAVDVPDSHLGTAGEIVLLPTALETGALAGFGSAAGAWTLAEVPAAGPAQREAGARAAAAAGAELASNPRLTLSRPAREALLSGEVDARVLVVLSYLLQDERISVADFPREPDAAPSTARRGLLVDEISGARPWRTRLSAYEVQRSLEAQRAQFTPISIKVAGGDLLVRFAAPSPTDVLPAFDTP